MVAKAGRNLSALGLLACLLLLPVVVHAPTPPSPVLDARKATSPQASALILRNVRMFDPESGAMSEPVDVVVAGRRIEAVGRMGKAAESGGARIIDCTGKYALPGLFDCHTHVTMLLPEGEEALAAAIRRFVETGITQVRDVGGPIEDLQALRKRMEAGEILGPDLYYTGPMLERPPLIWAEHNAKLPGFTVPVETASDVDSVLARIAAAGGCGVKAFAKWDRDVFVHLVTRAEEMGLRVVHDPGPPLFHEVPMDVSIGAGVRSIEHAKSPWPIVLRDDLRKEHDELLARKVGAMEQMAFVLKAAGLGAGSISPERLASLGRRMVEADVYLCPTLHVFTAMAADTSPKPEPMKIVLAGMEAVSRECTIRMAEAGVRMLVGQDGHDAEATLAEMRLMRACGVSEVEILRGATIHPARFLGIEDRVGSIAPGRTANLLVLDADPLDDIGNVQRVFLVVHHGRVVREPGNTMASSPAAEVAPAASAALPPSAAP